MQALAWLALAALGAEEALVPFQPPAEVPLPVAATFVTVRHVLPLDPERPSVLDPCLRAGDAALDVLQTQAAEQGFPHVVRLLESKSGRDLSIRATCRSRHAGKAVVGKSVELLALVVRGPDDASWPRLSGDRAAHLVWVVSDLTGNPPDKVELEVVDGRPVVPLHRAVSLDQPTDVQGRAAWVITQHFLPDVPSLVQALEPFPEIAGVRFAVSLTSRDPASGKRLRERFLIETSTAALSSFLKGGLTEQQLVTRSQVRYRPVESEPIEVSLKVDLDRVEERGTAPVEADRQLDDADLDALTDE